jgi:transposase
LVEQHGTLDLLAGALLRARATLEQEFKTIERRVYELARGDVRTKLLMSTPGVGAIVALTYSAAIDDPARFRSSRSTGAHFGLTQKKYQSGETDITGRISKIGDRGVRTALFEAAHVILTRPVRALELKSWAMAVAQRAGMKKAKVALARKLAVIMHRMLCDGTTFVAARAARPMPIAA